MAKTNQPRTRVVSCICKNQAQDEWYGKGKRVANLITKLRSQIVVEYRCTTCGIAHEFQVAAPKAAEVKQ